MLTVAPGLLGWREGQRQVDLEKTTGLSAYSKESAPESVRDHVSQTMWSIKGDTQILPLSHTPVGPYRIELLNTSLYTLLLFLLFDSS